MSLVSMTLAAEGTPAQERSAASRRARYIRPALGLIVPVTLALAWEIIVRLGWASGRLAPPPSVIFQTFVDLARTGELQRDTILKAGLALQQAGVIPGNIDVKKALDDLIDDRFVGAA